MPIPVTCFTGFLGAGKTTTILGLLSQLPSRERVVLLKNEYGDVEVDSLLAQQSSIAGVSEILNGCMCCTLVGQIETALLEIKEKMNPDRIIIESSGSAFPATLAIQIRQLAPQGFALDSVVTVVDCVNFTGYEDSSPTAKIQAKYTDLLILNKHELVTPHQLDTVLDHLYEINDETPVVRISRSQPLAPELVFGLDTKLFERAGEEAVDWEGLGTGEKHMDEVESRSVWRGGGRPGKRGKKRDVSQVEDTAVQSHRHADGEACACEEEPAEEQGPPVQLVNGEVLHAELAKLPFEIYRVKGFLRMSTPTAPEQGTIHILNWAFGRAEVTPMPDLDDAPAMAGVSFRLTVMGARGEVARRARALAGVLGGEFA
ncbi:hypothetical protein NCC49_005800 [Naganishia albida]|nr:hypothetical protein NCC49_005800 [Naganishia albida]